MQTGPSSAGLNEPSPSLLQQPLRRLEPGALCTTIVTGRDARLLEQLTDDFLRFGTLALRLQQLRVAHRGLCTGVGSREDAILLERFRHVALGFERARIQQMSHRGAEVGIEPDELIECRARPRGVSLAELRVSESQHEVGIVLVEPGERFTILADGLIVTPMTHQLLGVALTARDVAGDARLALVASQIGARIHRLAQAARGVSRGTAT